MFAVLPGCGSAPPREGVSPSPPQSGGGYYLDDGPGANPPPNLDSVPDAVPRAEPLHRGAARPYVVMGRHYAPMSSLQPYRARGIATWYGRRYHGKPTATGEPYDMYGMTAAHPTLPIPSYARVTHLASGRSVVVRVNDRGPFVGDRLIDLSYTAAHKLGIVAGGSAVVEVELVIPGREAEREASIPPATAEPPVDAAPVPIVAQRAGHYLQLGAFGSHENAMNFIARLQAQADWLGPLLHLRPGEGLFRVQAGPYAAESEARQAAERITHTLGAKPFLITR